jgi:AraC family transcriptional regulator of adaptative response/methylated-DNA-[protein]-cysteine methyltransferase
MRRPDDSMAELAAWIEAHADESLPLKRLAERAGLSPSRLQRRFAEAIGSTPAEYQRAVRLGRLKQCLANDEPVSGAIYEAGFGSVSRVYEHIDRDLGMTPARYRARGHGLEIAWAVRDTGLGPLLMAATERGVCRVAFGDGERALADALAAEFPNATLLRCADERSPQLDAWMAALAEHIDDGGPRPHLPLAVFGTALQVRTWRFLTSLRDDETVSYGDAAAALGKPRAARAIARACAANGVAVLVPCHRVLRKNGDVGGYRWGAERKRRLLDAPERAATDHSKPSANSSSSSTRSDSGRDSDVGSAGGSSMP